MTLALRDPPVQQRPSHGIGWSLLAVALALPWLVNRHAAPWTSFYTDSAMAIAMLAPATWLAIRSDRWPISSLALALLLLAVLPLAQAIGGLYSFASDAALPFAYLAALAIAVAIGHGAEAIAPGRLIDALFVSLVLAGIVSVGLALGQWNQLDMGLLAYPLPLGGRPVANIAQANLLATLLAWSLAGIWWGAAHRRIGGLVAVIAAGYLLAGIAATQSRTGFLEVVVLALAASLTKTSARVPWRVVLGLAAFFTGVVAAWPWLTQLLQLDVALSLGQQVSPGRRPAIWALGLDAAMNSPWFGYGVGNTVSAHLGVALDHPPLLYALTSHHNLPLDLVIWTGLPVATLVILGLGMWLVAQWRVAHTSQQWILLVALLLLLLHAMLELPHCYAVFLLPAGLMAGTLESLRGAKPVCSIPRWATGVLVIGAAGMLSVVIVEYQRIERDLLAQRVRAARIGDLAPQSAPPVLLLEALGGLTEFLRIEPERGMSTTQLADMRRVADRFPSGANLFRYAQAAALNGQAEEARRALDLLCRMGPMASCSLAGLAWNELAQARYPEMKLVQVPRAR
jgi:O-antigen ligase